ncbi:hypothetical protein [Streptomyces sp. SA3_actF]|uniref:hypothetical protein n=1 Tax=Streptomyces sp. SA3_actF TaxID=682181 RepID=UPI0002EDCC55|nr:hypothetical protein [Streptomyces sp. SA3_actF]
MDEFDVSDAEPTAEATGTVFEAFGGEDLQKLTEDTARTALTAAFALHLEAYPDIRIFFDGRQLDPASEQLRVDTYEVAARPESPRPPARLKIIEWSRPCSRALILCDERQMSLAHLKPEIQAPGFHFTAYLSWPGFEDDSIGDLSFADWTPDGPTAEVLAEARDRLRAHFRSRADERRRELVDSWRAEGFYPYAGEPVNDRERAERETFDAVATAVIRHLPASKRAQKVSFALLRSVLTHEPGDVLRIAEELFALSKQEQAELSRLLDRTPLSSLIKASTATTGRLDFLSALEHLVFAPVARARVKERTELHRVLENECWVFGEEYGLHVSDRSLNEVLRQHCRLLDREAPVPGPVVEGGREPGDRGPDAVPCRQASEGRASPSRRGTQEAEPDARHDRVRADQQLRTSRHERRPIPRSHGDVGFLARRQCHGRRSASGRPPARPDARMRDHSPVLPDLGTHVGRDHRGHPGTASLLQRAA